MLTNTLTITHSTRHVAPGAAPDTQDPAEYCKKSLCFGTSGSYRSTQGSFDVDGIAEPTMLGCKERGYYAKLFDQFEDSYKQHVKVRQPVWIARGFAYGTIALGAVLCSNGFHAPLGAALIAKGCAAGAAVGALGGVGHHWRSTDPYTDVLDLVWALHQMQESLYTLTPAPWMSDPAMVSTLQSFGPAAFDVAFQELRDAHIAIVSPYRKPRF